MQDKDVKVCVAVVTRRRPQMLASLLGSWATCKIPQNAEVVFLIVENDPNPGFDPSSVPTGIPLIYTHEPRIGIPFARNTAVRKALEWGAELIAFVDDDEIVTPDWLCELIAEQRNTLALLVGGPIEAVASEIPSSRWRALVFNGIHSRTIRKARVNERRKNASRMDRVTIVTNNWLAHRDLFEKHGIWFDERYALSGGSDAAFSAEVTRRDLMKAWAPKALVHEVMPPSRVSLRYQFCRGRDQSIVSFQRKMREKRLLALVTLVPAIIARTLGVSVLALGFPLTCVDFARGCGWITGRIVGLLGSESRLYENVTGD